MITIRAVMTSNLNFTSVSAESLNQFSNAKLVVYLPAMASGTVLYSWVTPSNLKLAERTLVRDAAEEVGDYVGKFAYSSQIYPGMTLGLTAQQDTGVALFRVRIGNLLSPLAKIKVLKSLTPEDTEMPPSQYEELDARIDAIEDDLAEAGVFVSVDVGATYDEVTDLDQTDNIYVERGGVGKFITANNMLGGIETNIDTLNYEAAVGTTIAEPDWARTWFDPIEEIVGNTVVENAPTQLENMNFTDETPEINLMAAMLDNTVNTNEQMVGLSENEVVGSAPQVESEQELQPGVSDSEYNPLA